MRPLHLADCCCYIPSVSTYAAMDLPVLAQFVTMGQTSSAQHLLHHDAAVSPQVPRSCSNPAARPHDLTAACADPAARAEGHLHRGLLALDA